METIKRVLLIDDDAISSWLNQTLIERTGLVEQIEIIDNGKAAIAYLQQHCSNALEVTPECPDLILLDLDMPIVSGFDVLDMLQQSADCSWITSTRLIVLTTTINPRDLQRAKTYNIFDFLVKPLTEVKLTELLKSLASKGVHQANKDRSSAPTTAAKVVPEKETNKTIQ